MWCLEELFKIYIINGHSIKGDTLFFYQLVNIGKVTKPLSERHLFLV